MLPAAARLTRSQEFGTVVRRGRRAGRSRLVVHAMNGGQHRDAGQLQVQRSDTPTPPTRSAATPTRVGFVVSRAVGNSVVRHRVTRRLRHLMRDRLGTLPGGCALVIRALPPAAGSSSRELGADLDGALRRLGLGKSATDSDTQ